MSKERQHARKNRRHSRLLAAYRRLKGYKVSLKAAKTPNLTRAWEATIKRVKRVIKRLGGTA